MTSPLGDRVRTPAPEFLFLVVYACTLLTIYRTCRGCFECVLVVGRCCSKSLRHTVLCNIHLVFVICPLSWIPALSSRLEEPETTVYKPTRFFSSPSPQTNTRNVNKPLLTLNQHVSYSTILPRIPPFVPPPRRAIRTIARILPSLQTQGLL